MHLVLTGATGLVGSGVLHHILALPSATAASRKITRLSILSRRTDIPLLTHPDRPTSNTYTQIEVISHTDFKTYPDELLARLRPIESDNDGKVGVIWALGISQTEVKTTAEYIEITKDYAIEAAKAFQRSLSSATANTTSTVTTETQDVKTPIKPQVNFVYVSGEGAQHNPGRLTPLFGKVKGETELELLELMKPKQSSSTTSSSTATTTAAAVEPTTNFHIYNVRPAGVDSYNQLAVRKISTTRDQSRNLSYRVMKATLLPVMRAGVLANTLSPTEELGRVFVDLASNDGGPLTGVGTEGWQGRVVRNAGLRRMFRDLEQS